jgi:hypothetical protein
MARVDRVGTARVRPPLGEPIAEKGSYPGGSARPAQDPASGSQSVSNTPRGSLARSFAAWLPLC